MQERIRLVGGREIFNHTVFILYKVSLPKKCTKWYAIKAYLGTRVGSVGRSHWKLRIPQVLEYEV